MKILNKHQKSKMKYQNIVVSDVDGETKIFDNVKEVAQFFEVHVVAIYKALKNGTKVRGCTLTTRDVK